MKTPITLLLPVCLLAGCTAQTGYVIEHSSPQYTDGKYMYVLDGVTWQPLDSARIENSAFRIASHNKGSGMGLLYMGASSNPADLAQVGYLMFLEDGTIHTLPDSTYEFVYRGTPMNDAYTDFQQFSKTATPAQQRDKLLQLVRQNRNVLGCQLLENLMSFCTKTEMESLMAGFPADLQQHPLFLQTKDRVDAIRADVGMPYLDLTGKDPQGKEASLSEAVGKPGTRYVLLDFWGTWCGPCRRDIPHLKDLYSQYKDQGFDIFGVAFDGNVEYWQQVVAQEELLWTNITAEIPAGKLAGASPTWKAYGLTGIPANFLIDTATGQIIAKKLRGETLDKRLAELLNPEE